jgi:hypothetical protein
VNYDPSPAVPMFSIVFLMAFFVLYLVLIAGVYVLFSWLLSRLFRKAGIPSWKAWVPIYNHWVFLELGGQQGWLAILMLVPVANIVAAVFLCIAAYNIGLAFSKEGVWVLLYIFVSWLWLAIVALDSSRWEPWRSPVPPIYGTNVFPPTQPSSPGY